MKTLITAGLVGFLLFAASAGVSWYVVVQQPEPEEVNEDEAPEESNYASAFPSPLDESKKMDAMPVSMRPEVPVSVEAVTELAQSIMKKEKMLNDAEKQLGKDEKRIQLLFEDLKREREELSAFGQSVDARIIEAREAVELLKMEHQSLAEQTKALSILEKKTGTNVGDAEADEMDLRVQTVKDWFKGLQPEQAVKLLTEFANRGDLEFAARVLDSLDEREQAKVLAVFDDTPLMAQIMDALTKNKKSKDRSAKEKEWRLR